MIGGKAQQDQVMSMKCWACRGNIKAWETHKQGQVAIPYGDFLRTNFYAPAIFAGFRRCDYLTQASIQFYSAC